MTTTRTDERRTQPQLRAEVDSARVAAWMDALADGDPSDPPPHQILGALAGGDKELGRQRTVLAEHAEHVFGYAELSDPGARAALVDGAARIVEEAAPRARRASNLLGGSFFHDDLHLVIRLVPGTRLCYGLPGGGQVFGMVPGASVEEACCFLEHTYYPELGTGWMSLVGVVRRTARVEAEEVFREELARLVTDPPDEQRLEALRSRLAVRISRSLADNRGRCSDATSGVLYGLPPDHQLNIAAGIGGTTRSDLVAATETLDLSRLVTLREPLP